MARTTQPVASPEAINAFIADVLKAPQALAAIMKAVKEAAAQEREETKVVDMEKAVVKTFKRVGFGEVKPRQGVKTYNLWIAEGRRVKPGEKSVRVKNLRLFHVSQTEVISEQEKAALLEQKAAKTADKLPTVTPVPAPQPAPKPAKAKATPMPGSGSLQ